MGPGRVLRTCGQLPANNAAQCAVLHSLVAAIAPKVAG
jgi:hypothetical protein